jgi:hypothetical protein
LADHARGTQKAAERFAQVEAKVSALGHRLIELEVLLDQDVMVGWLLSAPEASLGPAAVELAEAIKISLVRFLERQSEDAASAPIRYNGNGSRKGNRGEERSMKGPGLRQKNDLDRVWECASCHHREKSTGIQTSLICPKCARNGGSKPQFMKLIASPPTAPRRTIEVFSNTPVPVPVVSILGEDTARIPKKQALRPLPGAAAAEKTSEREVKTEFVEGATLEGTSESPAVDQQEAGNEPDRASDSSANDTAAN